ncbi:hypothetical protein KIPB_006725 [Kipferlia bialata]|uniref:Uncharacterized protein n=1 Tax=Kipferlia bialata TaxID=797122 RepID=A0A9K3CYZ1_9EUKA|nr:hypothetical protein KIPB_006725 [Kipferlia bialata]|eukprot:g6725.t1
MSNSDCRAQLETPRYGSLNSYEYSNDDESTNDSSTSSSDKVTTPHYDSASSVLSRHDSSVALPSVPLRGERGREIAERQTQRERERELGSSGLLIVTTLTDQWIDGTVEVCVCIVTTLTDQWIDGTVGEQSDLCPGSASSLTSALA